MRGARGWHARISATGGALAGYAWQGVRFPARPGVAPHHDGHDALNWGGGGAIPPPMPTGADLNPLGIFANDSVKNALNGQDVGTHQPLSEPTFKYIRNTTPRCLSYAFGAGCVSDVFREWGGLLWLGASLGWSHIQYYRPTSKKASVEFL